MRAALAIVAVCVSGCVSASAAPPLSVVGSSGGDTLEWYTVDPTLGTLTDPSGISSSPSFSDGVFSVTITPDGTQRDGCTEGATWRVSSADVGFPTAWDPATQWLAIRITHPSGESTWTSSVAVGAGITEASQCQGLALNGIGTSWNSRVIAWTSDGGSANAITHDPATDGDLPMEGVGMVTGGLSNHTGTIRGTAGVNSVSSAESSVVQLSDVEAVSEHIWVGVLTLDALTPSAFTMDAKIELAIVDMTP